MIPRGSSALARALVLPLAIAGSAWLSTGCTCRLSLPASVGVQRTIETQLPGRELELCLVNPATPRPAPALILYATGDGGWEGASKAVFRHLAEGGYSVVGISSRAYLRTHKSERTFITPESLAGDLISIIDAAKGRMNLPAATPTILVGVSRGAGLVAIAAAQESMRPRPAGVVAVALPRETDYVRMRRRRVKAAARVRVGRLKNGQILAYASLKSVYDVPISVIQSTNDRYLPAQEARSLFGEDTGMRRFRAVEARSHGFRGGREAMLRELDDSLGWIESLMKADAAPTAVAPPRP
jgi:pimeloyl-ACP methyl ester carboxylesterase